MPSSPWIKASLSCILSIALAGPLASEEFADAISNEAAFQRAAVQRQAGGYAATVTAADATFGITVGDSLTVVVIPARDTALGQVGVRLGQETIACAISTAEGGVIGFQDPTRPGYLNGLIRVDKAGSPIQLVLTRGTLEGLSSMKASLQRIPEPQ